MSIQGPSYIVPSEEKECLTHMDLWKKYNVTSIRENQYFLLLIDNTTRYVTLKFLKAKSDAICKVQAYLTHLQIRTHAICNQSRLWH
jgi:hypothetical protein